MSDVSSTYLVGILLLTFLGLIIVVFLTNAQRLPKFHKVSCALILYFLSLFKYYWDFLMFLNRFIFQWISLWGLVVGFIVINVIDTELNVIFWQLLHYIFNWYDDTVVLTSFSIGSVFVGETLNNEINILTASLIDALFILI